MERRKEITALIWGIVGVWIFTIGLLWFNQHVLMTLPLGLRMVSQILTKLGTVTVPLLIVLREKGKSGTYGICKEKIGKQIVTGVGIGIGMSLVLTLFPILLGFGDMVGDKHYSRLWQFVFEFVSCIFAVALSEEFIFRGFIYEKIRRITGKTGHALIFSSVLFGLYHLLGGNLLQAVMTSGLGAIFCICRLKIKNCTLLALVLAHGVYDAMIPVWISCLH